MQIRKDSILEDLQAPFSKFIMAVKLFLLEVPVNKAHKELDIAYSTAYKVYNKIREAIYQFVKEDDMLSGEVEMDECPFADKIVRKRVEKLRARYQYLAYLRDGGVKVEVVKNV